MEEPVVYKTGQENLVVIPDRPELNIKDICYSFRRGESIDSLSERYQIRHSEIESILRFVMVVSKPNYYSN